MISRPSLALSLWKLAAVAFAVTTAVLWVQLRRVPERAPASPGSPGSPTLAVLACSPGERAEKDVIEALSVEALQAIAEAAWPGAPARLPALEALAGTGSSEGIAAAEQALAGADPAARELVVAALAHGWTGSDLAPELQARLMDPDTVEVQRAAARALRETGDVPAPARDRIAVLLDEGGPGTSGGP